MSRLVVNGGAEGPFVEVASNVNLPESGRPNRVGLIAQPYRGRGWVELTPAQARELAATLTQAADETDRTAPTSREADR